MTTPTDHAPVLGSFIATCRCGRTFKTWRAQGIHETAANKHAATPAPVPIRDCPTCDTGGPGSHGWVTVAIRPDGTHELRPAYLSNRDPDDDDGTVVYSPDSVTGWRTAPYGVAATWRFWYLPGSPEVGWRPWVDVPGTVVVDGPTFGAARVGPERPPNVPDWPGIDTASSVSSQHYVDTGHYLPALPPCPECGSLDTMPDGPAGWLVCEQCCNRFDAAEVTPVTAGKTDRAVMLFPLSATPVGRPVCSACGAPATWRARPLDARAGTTDDNRDACPPHAGDVAANLAKGTARG